MDTNNINTPFDKDPVAASMSSFRPKIGYRPVLKPHKFSVPKHPHNAKLTRSFPYTEISEAKDQNSNLLQQAGTASGTGISCNLPDFQWRISHIKSPDDMS